MTTVGVVMSVYNGESTIGQALAGIAAQTSRPDAVVVVDDGSVDGTADRVEQWQHVLPLTLVRHAVNLGVAEGRTSGFRSIGTDLVLALDADDFWLPHHLATLMKAYEDQPGIVSPMAVGWQPERRPPVRWTRRLQPMPKSCDIEHLLVMNWLFSGSLFERQRFDSVGGCFRFPGCEDWDLWLRLLKEDVAVTVLREPTVLYRLHDANISGDDRMLPTEIEVLKAFLSETTDARLQSVARRSLRHRRARVALRAAYDHARHTRTMKARMLAIKAVRGPGPVALRAAAMVAAPLTTVRRRDAPGSAS